MRRFVAVFILLAVILAVLGFKQTRAPESESRFVTFEVASGQDVGTIGQGLKKASLIRSPFAFETYISLIKSEGKIQAGTYRVSTAMDLFEISKILINGAASAGFSVTLIEGWSLGEYREYLEKQGFDVAEFDSLTGSARQWKGEYDFLGNVPDSASLEGYLFPDTYAVGPDRSNRALITKMLENFGRKVGEEELAEISRQKKQLHEVIILASIVEKEVATASDRRKVADIFLRRLDANIGLQSDATVNYITGSGRTRSTAQDLAIDSPYNTYKYRGLPPGPIGNPGLEAIMAVIDPEPNQYFYFLTDERGGVHYARTFEEHTRNRDLYL